MNNGWIKINRSIADHWIFQDAEKFKLWVDLLFMANWEDRKVMHDSHLFVLKRGQMIASVSYLCERWDKCTMTVFRFLKLLEQDGMIKRQVLYRQTPIITICNYEKYQCREEGIIEGQIEGQIEGIVEGNIRNKEIKNNKEISSKEDIKKKTTTQKFKPPTVEEVFEYIQEKGYNVDAEHFVSYYESNGWKVGRNPMKSWKAAVVTWAKNESKTKIINLNSRQNGQIITNDDRRRAEKARRDEDAAELINYLMQTNAPVAESRGEFDDVPL